MLRTSFVVASFFRPRVRIVDPALGSPNAAAAAADESPLGVHIQSATA